MRFLRKIASISMVCLLLFSACSNGAQSNTDTTTPEKDGNTPNSVTTEKPATAVTAAATGGETTAEQTTPAGIDLPPSNVEVIDVPSQFDEQAEAMKQSILNMKDSINAAGQIYYVSNNGNDGNSGTSPEEAWASLNGVNNWSYDEGDAVLFQRGGLWRGSLDAKNGVFYGAYGTGPKPTIYGAAQNAATLEWEAATNLPDVYVCKEWYTEDVGNIIFNHGYAVGVKKLLGYDELKKNYDFYHNPDDLRVYLYMDKGNPAELFSDIEIAIRNGIINMWGRSNITIQNLCLKYGGGHGIGSGNISNVHISGCEIGWVGGSLLFGDVRYGNGIESYESCKDFVVENCYMYQIYDAGITHQYQGESEQVVNMEDVRYENNLLDYCNYSIEYFLTQKNNSKDVMKNILIKGNIMRYAGFGWGHQRPDKGEAAQIKSWAHDNYSDGFVIEDNILDRSRYSLFDVSSKDPASIPQFKNNTFAQTTGRPLCYWFRKPYSFDSNVKETIESLGIEKDPKVYFIK